MAFIIGDLLSECAGAAGPARDYAKQALVPPPSSTVPVALEAALLAFIGPDFDAGPWVVGGAPLRWYQGQGINRSDIDIFCSSSEQATHIEQRLASIGAWPALTSPNASTLKLLDPFRVDDGPEAPEAMTIQVIRKKFFDSLDDVFAHFDISVCQIATDGRTYRLGQNTAADIRHKTLRFENIRPDSLKRMAKYAAYGYQPTPQTYNEVLKVVPTESVFQDWAAKGDYDHAF